MSIKTDPAIYGSKFDRLQGDRYFTDPWMTEALMDFLDGSTYGLQGPIWEPAAGRGDMAKVFRQWGYETISSDIDISEFDQEHAGPVLELDFLKTKTPPVCKGGAMPTAIITNPPFGRLAAQFLRHALSFDSVKVVAFLCRSEFDCAGGRVDLFERADYAFELQFTKRPRWDWWFRDEPESGPRIPYSWFVWDRSSIGRMPTKIWHRG